jgi:xylulokinase
MLPGDYIALKLTGEVSTTVSGLSEGIFWDFKNAAKADDLLKYYQIDESLLSPLVPQMGEQGRVSKAAGDILGIKAGVPVSYRAGDQPNNAYSLNVLQPGEIAATAGTSGVVYGVTDKASWDPQSRVNSFVHVSHTAADPRYGILLCVNGTGSLNSWLRKNFFSDLSYAQMNGLAEKIAPGAEGIKCYPFGNGAERVLVNADPGAAFQGINFNIHNRAHIARAAQEGIVFALRYGVDIMKEMGMEVKKVRAGYTNMFLSEVFSSAFANTMGCEVELYNTDGAQGAARAAGIGAGIYKTFNECFTGMNKLYSFAPEAGMHQRYEELYSDWKAGLKF